MRTVVVIIIVIVAGVGLLVLGRGDDSAAPNLPHQRNSTNSNQNQSDQLTELISQAQVLGEATAPLTLVEFGDYQCTFCTRFFNETESALKEKYVKTGKLKLAFIDFAINGRESVQAAEASQCAADQARYWDFHDRLYQERKGYNVGVFNKDNLVRYAGELGLDTDAFTDCFESRKHKDKVAETTSLSPYFGARGTPTFLLNGHLIAGAQPLTFFEAAIEQLLAEAEAPDFSEQAEAGQLTPAE